MVDGPDEAAENFRREEATRPMAADEPTSTFDPFADDDAPADAASTQAVSDDRASTQAIPDDLASTRVMPEGMEATRALPADAQSAPAPGPGVWTARASVPVSTEPTPVPEPAQWEEIGDERAGRYWLRPVLFALVVIVLLAILGVGLWLIFSHVGGRPAPTPDVPATTTPAPTSSAAAPAPPAPPAPTGTAPTAATPAQVAVPDVVGQSEAAARQQLAAYGLTVTVVRRTTGDVAPGTVLATDPDAGTMVAAGSRVTLVVAAAPAPAPSAVPTRSAAPTRSALPVRSSTKP